MKFYMYPFVFILTGLFLLHGLKLISFDVEKINSLFMTSLIILLIGGVLHVKATGIFTLFFKGFSEIQQKIIRQSSAQQSVNEQMNSDRKLQVWKQDLTKKSIAICMGLGGSLFLFSFILALAQ